MRARQCARLANDEASLGDKQPKLRELCHKPGNSLLFSTIRDRRFRCSEDAGIEIKAPIPKQWVRPVHVGMLDPQIRFELIAIAVKAIGDQ